MTHDLVARVLYAALTLYKIAIILRWLGGWLELEVEFGRLRPIARITDPLINRLRNILPVMGPFDFGPIAALVLVWVVRMLLTGR